jgi:hypothetical protein
MKTILTVRSSQVSVTQKNEKDEKEHDIVRIFGEGTCSLPSLDHRGVHFDGLARAIRPAFAKVKSESSSLIPSGQRERSCSWKAACVFSLKHDESKLLI